MRCRPYFFTHEYVLSGVIGAGYWFIVLDYHCFRHLGGSIRSLWLVVHGDAVATAENIAASSGLFRADSWRTPSWF